MSNVINLIRDLKNRKKHTSNLTWSEFEDVVSYLIISQNSDLWNDPVKITEFKIGEIDIVIQAKNSSSLRLGSKILSPTYDNHFIECKHHSKKITLATAAKIFCAGILYQPKNLIIVSTFPLYRQALEYANMFFTTESSTGMFDKIFFDRVSLEQLLKIEPSVSDNALTLVNKNAEINYEILYWNLTEIDTFSERIIASTNTISKILVLDNNQKYDLQFWLSGFQIGKEEDVVITLQSYKFVDISKLNCRIITNFKSGEIKIGFYVDTTLLSQNINEIFLSINKKASKSLLGPIRLPKVEISNGRSLFNDFRNANSKKYFQKISRNNSIKLFLIHGEGGVGKSYFCERISKEFKQELNYKSYQFSINEQTSNKVFLRFIWPLVSIIDDDYDLQKDGEEIGIELLKALLRKVLTDGKIDNADDFINQFISLDTQNIDRETLIFICAKILTISPLYSLFLIKDFHKISPEFAKDIKLFFKTLDDLGWGNVKFFIEYRDTTDETNEPFNEFIDELNRDFKNKCEDYKINPLSYNELTTGIREVFIGEEQALLSEILIKKTGGNPLYIIQLVEYFIDTKYIEKFESINSNYKINIIDFSGLQKEIHILPKSVQSFLKRRVEQYFSSINNSRQRTQLISYLGLSSIINYQINEEKLRHIMELSEFEIKLLRFKLINDGFLLSSYSNPPAVFIHEMMQIAVKDILKHTIDFQIIATKLESTLSQKNIEDTLIGGKINYELQNLKESYEWFNIGYEIAHKNGSYTLQRICLDYMAQILSKNHIEIKSDIEKYLNICLSLGWNEFHTSSIINAIKIYKEILQKLKEKSVLFALDDREKYFFEIEAIHNLLTSYVELLWPMESSESMLKEISIIRDELRLLHLLNRLILFCSNSNFPAIGIKASLLSIKIINNISSLPKQIRSVLFSDIGHLFLISNPEYSLKLWKDGLSYAEDHRQINHSKINILVGLLHLNNSTNNTISLLEINENDILNQGVEGQIIRLFIYKAIQELYNKETDSGLYYLQKALNRSLFSNSKICEYESHNNLGVYYLTQNQIELAISHFEKAAIIISKTTFFIKSHSKEMDSLLYVIENKANNMLLIKSNVSDNLSQEIIKNKVYISGLLHFLLYNINNLNGLIKSEYLNQITQHIDMSNFNNENLFLLKEKKHPLIASWRGKQFLYTLS